jgi:hypothetical protein
MYIKRYHYHCPRIAKLQTQSLSRRDAMLLESAETMTCVVFMIA